MTIDVRGVNTHNKGAQLMMQAIADRLGDTYKLSVSPNGSDYDTRARLGYRQTLLINQAPSVSARLGNALPRELRRAFGLTSDADLTGVLDAAGFAYSDSFSAHRARREATHAARWRKRNLPIVFLPQAFGPFDRPDQRLWSGRLFGRASLLYARDKVSYAHVQSLCPSIDVRLAPDFTIGLKADGVPRQIDGDYGALVPNQKMITHAKIGESAYVSHLIEAGRALRASGIQPVIVIHEFNDLPIGSRLGQALGCEVFSHDDPIVLKRVLGDARVAVASRFHAIVGALSQQTPVLAYGWSHKYQALLSDFDVPQWLMTQDSNVSTSVLAAAADDRAIARLADAGKVLRGANDLMWKEVVARLDSTT